MAGFGGSAPGRRDQRSAGQGVGGAAKATRAPRGPAPKQGGSGGGFGEKILQKKEVTATEMAKAYERLTAAGAIPIDVYARVDPALGVVAASFPGSASEPPQEGSDWLVVGRVAVAAPGTLQQAAQHQKRLILEHATKISKRLRVQKNSLVCGLQTPFSVRSSASVQAACAPHTVAARTPMHDNAPPPANRRL